tara:strand:+ start:2438 stop:3061 length:624 start_codon:yes stop_codon:yes gene_type:complete
MSQSNELVELFKSRQNVLELLKKQGYDVSNYENASMTEVSVMREQKQMDMLVETDTGKKAYVKYHLGKTLRANNVYDYIEDLINLENVLQKTDDLIIIVKDDPNDSLVKVMKSIWKQDGVFVVVHGIKRLQFNILEHVLVPSHRILSDDEAEVFKQKFQISDSSQIPDIGRFSPVALAIGMRPGQICEITRPSNTAIEVPFYRVCSP